MPLHPPALRGLGRRPRTGSPGGRAGSGHLRCSPARYHPRAACTMDKAERAVGAAVAPAGWGGLRVLRVERQPDGSEVRYLEGGYRWHRRLDGSYLLLAAAPCAPDEPSR